MPTSRTPFLDSETSSVALAGLLCFLAFGGFAFLELCQSCAAFGSGWWWWWSRPIVFALRFATDSLLRVSFFRLCIRSSQVCNAGGCERACVLPACRVMFRFPGQWQQYRREATQTETCAFCDLLILVGLRLDLAWGCQVQVKRLQTGRGG